MKENILIIYYSYSGKTRRIAEMIHRQNGGRLSQIYPRQPYPTDFNRLLRQVREENRTEKLPSLLPVTDSIFQSLRWRRERDGTGNQKSLPGSENREQPVCVGNRKRKSAGYNTDMAEAEYSGRVKGMFIIGQNFIKKEKQMKRCLLSTVILAVMLTTACSAQPVTNDTVSGTQPDRQATEEPAADVNDRQQGDERILIAYFTRLDNTDAEIDDIIRGGGPYGEIGDSLEDADMDAVSSASITIYNDQIQGNTQTIAQMIQENVGGDLFSIRTEEQYPTDYDELIDLGGEEEAEDVRPELISHVDNMADYDIIFLGYPNWWQDMPMAVYSFLEEYDFSGKTIVPFCSHGGGRFGQSLTAIAKLVPDAVMAEGLAVNYSGGSGIPDDVAGWLAENDIPTIEE